MDLLKIILKSQAPSLELVRQLRVIAFLRYITKEVIDSKFYGPSQTNDLAVITLPSHYVVSKAELKKMAVFKRVIALLEEITAHDAF